MSEVVEAALLAVALPGRVGQGQVARVTSRRLGILAKKTLFDGDRNVLGKADADKPARGDGITVANQASGFGRADDLAALAGGWRSG